jgi:drug/metabolite transporter (DMT)-like permease
MSSKKELLDKAIKYLLYALPMMFIGPAVIYNAFQNKDNIWHYLVLAIGIAICISSVYFLFKGVKNITDSLFQNDN